MCNTNVSETKKTKEKEQNKSAIDGTREKDKRDKMGKERERVFHGLQKKHIGLLH